MNYLEVDFVKKLDSIQTPVLFLHSKKDPISDYRVLPEYIERISSKKKEIKYFTNGNHVINHDPDLVIKHILDFSGQ